MTLATLDYTDPDGDYRVTANDWGVIVTVLVLDDGTPVAGYGGEIGHYTVADEDGNPAQAWGPEPEFPDDDTVTAVIAEHLGVDPERISLGSWDGCDGQLTEAIATVLVDGEVIPDPAISRD